MMTSEDLAVVMAALVLTWAPSWSRPDALRLQGSSGQFACRQLDISRG